MKIAPKCAAGIYSVCPWARVSNRDAAECNRKRRLLGEQKYYRAHRWGKTGKNNRFFTKACLKYFKIRKPKGIRLSGLSSVIAEQKNPGIL
jgi:hypothetical protein